MCGIIGFVGNTIKVSKFKDSLNLIKHRGPDNLNIKTYYYKKKKNCIRTRKIIYNRFE